MSDRGQDSVPEGMGLPIGAPAAGTANPQAPAGWYPDPWRIGQRRFWTGQAWTPDVIADNVQWSATESAPPRWTYATVDYGDVPPQLAAADAPPPRRTGPWIIAGVVVGCIVLASVAGVLAYRFKSTTRPVLVPPPALAPIPPQTTLPAPADPSASALDGLVIRQPDVASTVTVVPLPNGDQVAGQSTLDLCNGTYPSEAQRTSRRQVAALDAQGNTALSTEAVMYRSSAGTVQAFAELRGTVAHCPSTPVVSPVGEPTVTTKFNAAPDTAWAQTPGVERLAYDFVTTDQAGQLQHSVAVYLRRGRVLMGVYFAQPDGAQPAVNGATTVPAIVNVFATRLAQLPASVVGP